MMVSRNDQPAGKFSPNIAEMLHPLQELFSAKKVWAWGPSQDNAFLKLKCELTTPGILVHCNPDQSSVDASSHEWLRGFCRKLMVSDTLLYMYLVPRWTLNLNMSKSRKRC